MPPNVEAVAARKPDLVVLYNSGPNVIAAKQLERSGTADLIILDAPAAGHAVNFLLSARGLVDAVKVGPIQKQAADVVELLTDPGRCQVLLVTIPLLFGLSRLLRGPLRRRVRIWQEASDAFSASVRSGSVA